MVPEAEAAAAPLAATEAAAGAAAVLLEDLLGEVPLVAEKAAAVSLAAGRTAAVSLVGVLADKSPVRLVAGGFPETADQECQDADAAR